MSILLLLPNTHRGYDESGGETSYISELAGFETRAHAREEEDTRGRLTKERKKEKKKELTKFFLNKEKKNKTLKRRRRKNAHRLCVCMCMCARCVVKM
jgi:hypothetical protein